MPVESLEMMVRAPGRVNLIGEHTDYNDGFVLPVAIDLELRLRFRKWDGGVRLRSCDLDGIVELAPLRTGDPHPSLLPQGEGIKSSVPADGEGTWGCYVRGVYELMRPKAGIEGEIASDIPVGSGLSSSAALELALARALTAVTDRDWRPLEAAKLCQRAEIEYAGNRCGIMDQLAVAMGKAGHALLIDCRSLEVQPVPLPQDLAIVVCDSAKPRQLTASAYNERRAACEEAARLLGVRALRDAGPEMLERLPEQLRKRARHVVEEDQRVLDFVTALRAGDRHRVGDLMIASHASLRDLYEVSCPELDLLVQLAQEAPGCAGSRLTGAGFGGCTVSLVDSDQAGEFASAVIGAYQERTGLFGKAYICSAVDGASRA